ncbi:hypothetical protein GWL_32280 [Herbaspirillum sp. GW103]|nr:hypothetical protein GWL_32280 [Herbaspirillum sp. GW103]
MEWGSVSMSGKASRRMRAVESQPRCLQGRHSTVAVKHPGSKP